MRIAIYIRISTNAERQDLNNQLKPLREWALRLGEESPIIYEDEASGTKSNRNGLNKLLEDGHKRIYDTLLVWALDRLSREGIGRMAGYLEQLRSYGIRVLSHQEPWLDTAGPVSELLTAIFGWVAQQERNRIRERVKAGLNTAKAKGRKLGRPQRRFDLERAKTMLSNGHSLRSVAQVVGVPRATLARAVSKTPSFYERKTTF